MDKLPDDSCTWSEIRDNLTPEQMDAQNAAMGSKRKHGRWSRTDMLLALLADLTAIGNYEYRVVNTDSKKRNNIKPPKPVTRPGVEEEKAPAPEMTEAGRNFLERLRRNRGYTPPSEARAMTVGGKTDLSQLRAMAQTTVQGRTTSDGD